MKRSLWILALSSLLFFSASILFVFFTRTKKVSFKKIRPIEPYQRKKLTISDEKINYIYENDLFNTYIPKDIVEIPKENIVPNQPKVPIKVSAPNIKQQEPKFLEPLPYTLVSIIISADQDLSSATLSDNRTKKEMRVKINDEIDDGLVIEINPKSITIIRSNGQEEIIYLPGTDKILQEINKLDSPFSKKINENEYEIDPIAFSKKINSLGDLITELNLTTAYKNGISVGCKIGPAEKDGLISKLGLDNGDIVNLIAGKKITNIEERSLVYKKIIALKEGDEFEIELSRKNKIIKIKYLIRSLDKPLIENGSKNKAYMHEMIKEDLQRRYQFAPTVAEIKEKERVEIIKQLSKKNN